MKEYSKSMAYKIYIREAESVIDVMWHDVTDRILVGNLKLRQGFSSLGSGADLGKITLTYKAYDLATAALFSTSTKCIRIIEGDYILFEGYADSSSSVDSTESTDLAWVKISAYPYLKAMEDVKATEGHVWYDKTAKELMEAMWELAVTEAPAWLQNVIETSCDIIFPEISQVIPFAKISADDSYLDIIMDIAGEYCYSVRTEGSGMITFLKAYSQENISPMAIPYNAVFAKPTIKASPYIFKKAPEVTLSRIVEKNNIDVYSLSDDGSSAEQLIENGKYYPEEGDAEVSYSAPSIETDMLALEWADGLSLSYVSRNQKDATEGYLEVLNLNLSGDSATFRLHNYNPTVSCYLNQLWIKAQRAFFRDSSIVVKADVEGEKSEIETAWIQTEAQAREYAKAIADEARCSTSSLSFKSDVFKLTDIRPGALIKVGDISSTYIVKTIERNLEDDSIQYQCQIYALEDFDTRLLYRSSSSIRGPKGNDAPSLYYIWSSSETELKPRSRGFWRLGGKWMLYGGRAVGDFLAQDWEKNWTEVMNERSETYRYLWAKVGEDGEPFLFQGVSAADFSVIVSPSSYTINPRSLTPYKVNLKISRLNNLKGISDLILNNTYQGITLEKLGEDEWEVTIEQRMNTPLRFSFTASVNDASKGYTVTGTLIDYEEKYLGPVDTLPSDGEPYGRLLDGDWCVLNSENVLYVWKNNEWQPIENSGVSTMDRLDKMSIALSDMIKIGTTDKTTATVLGLFQLLCADSGFIKFLKTWALYCGAGDESTGFYCRIADHDPATGAPLSKPLFIVKYNGNTVFQIDPASGNVFMGRPSEGLSTPETGFMYRASDGVLISKNGYVVIDDDGKLYTQNAQFKGTIESADGTFTGTFNTKALISKPDTDTAKTNTYNSSGIANGDSGYSNANALYSWINGLGISGAFACTLSIDSSVTYGKISYEYTGSQSIYLILLYTESGAEKYRVRFGTTYSSWGDNKFCSSTLTSAFTLTVGKFTGEKLYMDVPFTSAGLTEKNRVYRDENGFLKVITS